MPLDEGERVKKVGLKLNIKNKQTNKKITALDLITSWQIEGENVEAVTAFLFSGSKITADGDCSPEIRRHLLLGRKAMKNLDSILKSEDITLLTKVHISSVQFRSVAQSCPTL